jgi:lysophospholipase L1-like esterase
MAVALLIAAATSKAADLIYGSIDDTQVRHRLRLSPNADVRHHTTEFDYRFRTNSLGFRGADYSTSKPQGTLRVVVLGDSFIAGAGVPDDEVLTVHLEHLLNTRQPSDKLQQQYEVINTGRSGTSTIRELEIYERMARRFQPDIVVLAFYLGNDLMEIVDERDSDELQAWRPQGPIRRAAHFWCPNFYLQLAILKQQIHTDRELDARTEKDVLASIRAEALHRELDVDVAEQRFHALPTDVRAAVLQGMFPGHLLRNACLEPDAHRRSIDPDPEFFEEAWPRVAKHLKLLNEAVTRDGAQLAIMVIPSAVQVDAKCAASQRALGFDVDSDWLTRSGRTGRAIQSWAGDHEIPYLDLMPDLRANPVRLYHLWDIHFNAAGHRTSAELLKSFLLKHIQKTG